MTVDQILVTVFESIEASFGETLAWIDDAPETFGFLSRGRNPAPIRIDVTTITSALLRELGTVANYARTCRPETDGLR